MIKESIKLEDIHTMNEISFDDCTIENKIVLKDGTIKVCDIKSINNGMLNITQTKDQLIYQAYLVKKQLDTIIENNKYALSA